ncbi:gamma-glutamyltransferase [Mesorhizobium australicum]|uniref:Glutathione hydrolase proenzyme n=1 Tax=Mesorhizobium australicum TaxID=536018 RepID=A0A1X7PED6_9HYPH|nr:gamma-glutamyltransferase [Mesorhizobium australicum]SMH49684.1 gamma-glutamyltransferase 1 Threonine peptidase. MEROPS family T03 [Mesorhizobium australicum]
MTVLAKPLRIASVALSLALPLPAFAQQAADTIAPEAATTTAPKAVVHAQRHMVAAANPAAAQAGLDVLRAGGSAADAVVAVQTVLGLVEPQSSGLGGGAFLVWYDAASGKVTTFDGRETAPKAATGDLFLGTDGKPLKFFEAVVGGRSVGTPGAIRLLEAVHGRYGKLDWTNLLDPAIDLATNGFTVSPRLAALVADDADKLGTQASTRDYFFPTGKPIAAGQTLRNPAYAETLAAIAKDGPDAFYKGPVADSIVEAVRSHPINPGLLSGEDLADYKAIERPAVCAPYRGLQVCGMGPPSSGALAIGQILGMVEPFDLATLGPEDPESWRILGDATRLAFADRERYVADADFVSIPKGLLNADYLSIRSTLLRRPTALPQEGVTAGDPPWDKAELRRDGASFDMPSTTHFVIVDDEGNVASMTSSIENGFGSRLMTGGFLLNNQLTDFSFAPEEDGRAVANRVEPGKRPRSSMSPTIILRDGKPIFALGSPGGSSIIPYVAKTIVALVDWKMDISQAIALPHLTNRFGTYDVEAGTSAVSLVKDLEALGYKTAVKEQNSGLQGIAITANGIDGGADPRREGIAVGD